MTAAAPTTDSRPSLELLDHLVQEVETVFHGKKEVVRLALAALLARGHILFEDVPGVGKTTLSHALAKTLGLGFRRVQFTSDLLPSDVLGVSIYNPQTTSFEIRQGPIFTNVVVADEINRAPPRTQSGLLEAMQDGSVTIDDQTFSLPRPFLVMATQNPLEHHGTYPLPESQLDRFLMRITIGYPDGDAERRILAESASLEPVVDRLRSVLTPPQVLRLQSRVEEVEVDPAILDYLMTIVERTRTTPKLRMGVSPRGNILVFRAARAYALTHGRTYLVPDDVRDLIVPCLAHRILPAGSAGTTFDVHDEAASVLEGILDEVEAPV
ncbi:MAG: MoxR family ATPase [Gemmatimonadota bacterium]|nr:MoxR family ATPase [Gemmatimonadota bacterium]MDE3005427.1 MoxR family ATPase [Gemmatimonadota bacterium]MDE3012525.1 MoxR family ATPase [Gemmatimonadota bacterium]